MLGCFLSRRRGQHSVTHSADAINVGALTTHRGWAVGIPESSRNLAGLGFVRLDCILWQVRRIGVLTLATVLTAISFAGASLTELEMLIWCLLAASHASSSKERIGAHEWGVSRTELSFVWHSWQTLQQLSTTRLAFFWNERT